MPQRRRAARRLVSNSNNFVSFKEIAPSHDIQKVICGHWRKGFFQRTLFGLQKSAKHAHNEMSMFRFWELLKMPIARIIMGEQITPAAQEQLLEGHREACRNGFLASADFSIAVKIGDTSWLIITVYETAEIAEANKDARTEWFAERADLIRDDFYYEGDVATLIKGGGGPLLSKYPEKLI